MAKFFENINSKNKFQKIYDEIHTRKTIKNEEEIKLKIYRPD